MMSSDEGVRISSADADLHDELSQISMMDKPVNTDDDDDDEAAFTCTRSVSLCGLRP